MDDGKEDKIDRIASKEFLTEEDVDTLTEWVIEVCEEIQKEIGDSTGE